MLLLLAVALAALAASAAGADPTVTCRPGGTGNLPTLHRGNFTATAAAAWCRNTSLCRGFSAEVACPPACGASAAVLDTLFLDSWAAQRTGKSLTWCFWDVPGPRPAPPPPPPPPPPITKYHGPLPPWDYKGYESFPSFYFGANQTGPIQPMFELELIAKHQFAG